jgi:predicted nucleic acid-binding protein
MLLIADTSPIISLLLIEQLEVLEHLFPEFLIPQAVWEELRSHHEISVYHDELNRLAPKVREITYHFPISGIDRGETEAIMLYLDLHADYLLIDDKKAREKAELFDIKCIGTLGLLFLARQKGLIEELRPLFEQLLQKHRYYAKTYLNLFLRKSGEQLI